MSENTYYTGQELQALLGDTRTGTIHPSHQHIQYLRSDMDHDFQCIDCDKYDDSPWSWGNLELECKPKPRLVECQNLQGHRYMSKKKRKSKKLYAKWWYQLRTPACYGTWGSKHFLTWGERGWWVEYSD